jgi:hypothetical protein
MPTWSAPMLLERISTSRGVILPCVTWTSWIVFLRPGT